MRSNTNSIEFRLPRHQAMLLAAVALTMSAVGAAVARADVPLAPASGCPQAHCDQTNSDLANLPPPTGPVEVAWHRNKLPGEIAGSGPGLGCSANGEMAVCTYTGFPHAVVAYDYDGNHLWSSGHTLNPSVAASAPLIMPNGDTIVPDSGTVVRFDNAGNIVWNTPLPYVGVTISPVITESGTVVLATSSGFVYAVESESGTIIGMRVIKDAPNDPGRYVTQNTPAVVGNRVYISMHHELFGEVDPGNRALLVALDIDRHSPIRGGVVTVAWQFPFGAVSRSSPLVIGDMIFFDAERPAAGDPLDYHIFGVRDEGDFPNEVWQQAIADRPFASFGRDPRGGFWHFTQGTHDNVVRRSEIDGSVLQVLTVGNFVNDPGQTPCAAMTLTDHNDHPVMITSTVSQRWWEGFWIVAIDLVAEETLWTLHNDDIGPASQFPLLTNGVDTRTVFPTRLSGARAVGPAAWR